MDKGIYTKYIDEHCNQYDRQNSGGENSGHKWHNQCHNGIQSTINTLSLRFFNRDLEKCKMETQIPSKVGKIKKKCRNKSDLGGNFIAPDGGWGWLVSIAAGLNILVTFASAQNLGIMYRHRMTDLGISTAKLTTIINVEITMTQISGLFNGPLFRRFTFRQIGLAGSVLVFSGLFLSLFANSFIFYICSFSLIYGLGRGLIVSSSTIALNTYFKERRRTATAYQYGVAGLGPICLPYLATFLMEFFGMHGTVLIFSGISLHTLCCSLIFQPARWHVKKSKEIETIKEPQRDGTIQQQDHNTESTQTEDNLRSQSTMTSPQQNLDSASPCVEQKPRLKLYQKIIDFFEFDLLSDITYLNLAIGLTLVAFLEVNFGILTPFILADFGYDYDQIASALSLLGFSDLVLRFLVPLITAKFNFSNKTYFICGVISMNMARILLTISRNYYVLLGTCLWLGLSKAFRIIFWTLILPAYVPLKRLPAASGLQLMISSVLTMIIGPLIGLIKDSTNYAFTINFLNGLCFIAVFSWLLESVWRNYRQRKTKEINEEKQ